MVTRSLSRLLQVIAASLLAVILLGCKPVLSRTSAPKILPDGMPVEVLTNLLGEPALIQNTPEGCLVYFYFFHFVNDPPKVKVKSDIISLTIVVSNGVVCERIISETY